MLTIGSNTYNIKLMIIRLLIILNFISLPSLHAQNEGAALWNEVDQLVEEADQVLVPIFLDNEFRSIARSYLQIKNNFERNGFNETIANDLRSLSLYISDQIETVRIIKEPIVDVMAARNQAIQAGADTYAITYYNDAESLLNDLSSNLEREDLESLSVNSLEAMRLYNLAELEAIELTILRQSINLLSRARMSGVHLLAPRKFNEGEEILNQAKAILNNDRTAINEALAIQDQAIIVISQSINLARQIQMYQSEQISEEDLILLLSKPIVDIANFLSIKYDYLTNPNILTSDIIQAIQELEASSDSQENINNSRRLQLNQLESEISTINERLTVSQEERNNLILEIEQLTAAARRFNQVEEIFDNEEATIIRENNDMLIRLSNITFESGSSNLSNTNDPIFQKIIDAINIFPEAIVLVEGHTDSSGDYESNLALSQLRATTVQNVLVEHYNLPLYQVTSLGYGELRPIANDETVFGQEQNRRIEIRIALER
jgi:outer membrane protein OmpA-like peptidoglycan-associated protein